MMLYGKEVVFRCAKCDKAPDKVEITNDHNLGLIVSVWCHGAVDTRITPRKFFEDGRPVLETVNAFDAAEIARWLHAES